MGHAWPSLGLCGPQAGERGRAAAEEGVGSRLEVEVFVFSMGWDLSTFKRSKRTKCGRGKKKKKEPKQVVGMKLRQALCGVPL